MIKYYPELIQGSDEWLSARCGLLTASEMKLIVTPTLKMASNDKERQHLYELMAQRITKYVEPSYISDDMMRGWEDENKAKALYAENYAPITDMGFITNDKWGFTLGYSPDGLVGDDGLVECKSRRAKYQVEVILSQTIDADHILQCQTGPLVSERGWVDYISFCGGLPMAVIRVYPDEKVQAAILEAAYTFETKLQEKIARYQEMLADKAFKLIPTERTVEMEIKV